MVQIIVYGQYGRNVAIDGSDMPPARTASGSSTPRPGREQFSDPDASWGHRSAVSTRKGRGFDMAVRTATDLPIAWNGDHMPPCCEHGEWPFAEADYGRKATKWRCPTREYKPASRWIKADRLHPLIPHGTPRFSALHRRRAAVERELGRLRNECGLSPLRVRGLDRVRLHADLTILAKLACALSRARAVSIAA